MTLSYADLKLYPRSICIHNWHLQKYIGSSIKQKKKRPSVFKLPQQLLNQNLFHILIEKYTLDGHVHKSDIYRSTSGQLQAKTCPLL